MITDPDTTDHHQPRPGEKLWHGPWRQWVRVVEPDTTPYDSIPAGAVPVQLLAHNGHALAQLASLHAQAPAGQRRERRSA